MSLGHRLVTLTGAGGIGKTRIGWLVAARAAAEHFPKVSGSSNWRRCPTRHSSRLPRGGTRARTVRGHRHSRKLWPSLVSVKKLLLVLDNCEHVIDAAATMAEALLRAAPASHLIATSREPLKVEGEQVYPVPPLGIPAEHAEGDDDPLRYGAVRLFLERARAVAPHFAPDQRQTAMVATICRRLDGIPLAIELAAARVAALGVEELAVRLDDRFHLLTGGRRTALPRHQTLRATLDWSYDLLSEGEKLLFRRLGGFRQQFRPQGGSGHRGRTPTSRRRKSSSTCPVWSQNHWSPRTSTVRSRASVWLKRHGPMRSKSSPPAVSANGSHAVLPNMPGIASNRLRPHWRAGLQPNC